MHAAEAKLQPQGQAYSAETWHKYYASRFLGCSEFQLPNGKSLTVPNSSSELDTEAFADYMAAVESDLNERGVFLDE